MFFFSRPIFSKQSQRFCLDDNKRKSNIRYRFLFSVEFRRAENEFNPKNYIAFTLWFVFVSTWREARHRLSSNCKFPSAFGKTNLVISTSKTDLRSQLIFASNAIFSIGFSIIVLIAIVLLVPETHQYFVQQTPDCDKPWKSLSYLIDSRIVRYIGVSTNLRPKHAINTLHSELRRPET